MEEKGGRISTVKRKLLKTKQIRSKKHSGELVQNYGFPFQQNSLMKKAETLGMEESQLEQQFNCIIHSKLIDHIAHSHIRGNTECFFNFKELQIIMLQIGFIESSNIHWDLLQNIWIKLGGRLYGGIVKQNLLSFLKIING